jgi:hypothetical protein
MLVSRHGVLAPGVHRAHAQPETGETEYLAGAQSAPDAK